MSNPTTSPRLDKLKADLCEMEPKEFVMHWMFDAVPVIFPAREAWTAWKVQLAENLEVDAHSLVVIGSGCVGYSLNPNKRFRQFGEDSDVDVAVVSSYHFEVAWRFIRDVGAKRHRYPSDVQNAITRHREEYVFWGTIATEKILPSIEPFGKSWVKTLAAFEAREPVNGKQLNVRIYRDSYSLVGYHVNGVRKLRQSILDQ